MIPIIARPWPLNLGYWHWWWTSWRVLWGSVARLPSGVDREAIWDRQQNYGSPYPRPLLDSSANQHVDVMAWYGMCSIPYPKSFVVFFKDIQAFEHYILACPFLVSRAVWPQGVTQRELQVFQREVGDGSETWLTWLSRSSDTIHIY